MAEKNEQEPRNESVSGDGDLEETDMLASSSGSEADQSHKRQKTQTPTPIHPASAFMVQPSPPKFISFEDLMAAAKGVKNMSLAHEIAVDSDFKLEKVEPPVSSMEKQVKEMVHRAFWDVFQEKISEDPPDFSMAVQLIQDVKQSLMSVLLPQHTRLKTQIEEVLDTQLIEQKLENDAFDIYYYSGYVTDIMGKLCAPARDERIAKIKDMKDIIPLFKEIFEVLDLMRMDMANFTIQQIRPYIQQQSVEYEKKKFDEFLKKQQESGVDGLELTRLWIGRSFDSLNSAEASLGEAGSQANIVTPAAIMNGAYMELLQWDTSRIYPETLVLDQGRLLDLRERTSHLTLVTSVILVTYNTVGESIAGVQALKVKLKDEIDTLLKEVEQKDLENALEGVGEQVNKAVAEFHAGHGFSVRDEGQQKTLTGQIKGLANPDNPVINLMSKRVLSFIQQALFSKHTEPLKVPVGMSVMEKELSEICGQFLRLISHNRAVFGHCYADIIGALLKRREDELSPRD